MKKIVLIGIFIFLIMFGCVDKSDILYNTTGAERDVLYNMTAMQLGDGPNQTNLSEYLKDFCNETGVCTAFVCSQKSRGFGIDLFWSDSSLLEQRCWVIKGNSSDEFTDDDYTLLQKRMETLEDAAEGNVNVEYDFFRIGTGSSFLEGIYGDYYTNCSNTMHQKWLMSNPDNSIYPYPNRKRLEVMLQKGQIPMIVIPKGDAKLEYMTEDYLDYAPVGTKARWLEIEKMINYSFKNDEGKIIGPIILVIEVGADVGEADSVQLEASYIKHKYPEILVAIDPPKENRTEFLDMAIYGSDTSPLCKDSVTGSFSKSACVDMIAEDIIFNDFDRCDGHYVMVHLFKRGLNNLKSYSKPSIIHTFGGKTGSNYDDTCEWFTTDLTNTYEILMREIPFLTHAGYLMVQSCSPVKSTLTSNANPLCNDEDYVLNKVGDGRPLKVWMVNTWGYLETGSQSPLVFADNGAYSYNCLGLANFKWFSPELYSDIERDESDIEYSFYDETYNSLSAHGDNVFNYAGGDGYNRCAPAFVCNIQTASSGFAEYVSEPYSLSSDDCSLFDNGAPYPYDGTMTTAGYADKYEFEVFLIRSLAKVEGYDNLENKTHNFYNSYIKSYNLSKEFSNIFDPNYKAREWQILGLAVYDYFGDGDARTLVLFSSDSSDLKTNLKNGFSSESKDFLKWYQSYIRDIDCNWYYENMCFEPDYLESINN